MKNKKVLRNPAYVFPGFGKKGEGSTLAFTEIVKIILGIVGLVILIALAVALAGVFTEKNGLIKAQRVLEDVEAISGRLEVGEVKEYILELPKDSIFMWDYSKKEVCICENSGSRGGRGCSGWFKCGGLKGENVSILSSFSERCKDLQSYNDVFRMEEPKCEGVGIKRIFISREQQQLIIETQGYRDEQINKKKRQESALKIEPELPNTLHSLESLFKVRSGMVPFESKEAFDSDIKIFLGDTGRGREYIETIISSFNKEKAFTQTFSKWEISFYNVSDASNKEFFTRFLGDFYLTDDKKCFEEIYITSDRERWRMVLCIE